MVKMGSAPKESLDNSHRAKSGKLFLLHEQCPYCMHDRVLENNTFKKCARCKREIIGK